MTWNQNPHRVPTSIVAGDRVMAGDRADHVVRRLFFLPCEGWCVEMERPSGARRTAQRQVFPIEEVALLARAA